MANTCSSFYLDFLLNSPDTCKKEIPVLNERGTSIFTLYKKTKKKFKEKYFMFYQDN